MNLLALLPESWRRAGSAGVRKTISGCRRVWVERKSGWRAIAPAWPAGFGALAAIIALCVTDQGLEALLVTVDLGGGEGGRTNAETLQRYFVFLAALVFFCMGVIASALFVMAVERDEADLEDDTETRRARARAPQDAIHNSVELRTRTAFVFGLATPVCLLVLLTAPFDDGAGSGETALRWMAALGAGFAVYWLCKLFEWPTVGAQQRLRAAYARRNPDLADLDAPASISIGRWLMRMSDVARYRFATLLHWMFKPPHRHGVALLAVFAVFAVTREEILPRELVDIGDLDRRTWVTGREWGSLGIVLATAIIGFLFLSIRHRSMKVLELREGRRLVFDRVFQTGYRGLSLLVVLVLLGALWLPAVGIDAHRGLGPVALLLAGLSILVSFFIWLVRNAIETPVEVVATIRPRWLAWPTYKLGLGVEWLQRLLRPIVIVGFGFVLLALDKITLPLLERATDGGAGAILGLVIAVPATIAVVWWLVREWRLRFGGGVARRSMRFASIMVLAPFAIATLGQNHQVASVARSPDAQGAEQISAHADEWLRYALTREPCAAPTQPAPVIDAPIGPDAAQPIVVPPPSDIVAVVVLAEGGGLRASSQAGQLLAALEVEDASAGNGTAGCTFFDHVYAMSGVSGGAVGLATYLAARAERKATGATAVELEGRIYNTLAQDHLSALFGGMFASDVLTTIVPVELPSRVGRILQPSSARHPWMMDADVRGLWDRADFFERGLSVAWSVGSGKSAQGEDWFEKPLEDVARKASGAAPEPVILFGAFAADDGAMTAASNVALGGCFAPAPDRSVTDLIGLEQCFEGTGRTMPLSTAAHLSARFPGSNPPAVLPSRIKSSDGLGGWSTRQVVDGGYYDNSGSAAASFAVKALYAAAEDRDRQSRCVGDACVRSRLKIVVLHILTTTGAAGGGNEKTSIRPTFPEITTPFSAVLRARENSGRLPLDGFCRLVAFDAKRAESGCDDLLKVRPGPASDHTSRGDVTGAKGVYWVSAPLVVSDDRRGDEYILLGWMLKEKSHIQIHRQMNCIAGRVLGSVRQVTGQDDDAPAGTGPLTGAACR